MFQGLRGRSCIEWKDVFENGKETQELDLNCSTRKVKKEGFTSPSRNEKEGSKRSRKTSGQVLLRKDKGGKDDSGRNNFRSALE